MKMVVDMTKKQGTREQGTREQGTRNKGTGTIETVVPVFPFPGLELLHTG
jgi:hypothetical protein